MTRSGMETILSAVLYSGFCSKRVLFSSVETSSVGEGGVVSMASDCDCGELSLREVRKEVDKKGSCN